MFRDRTDAGLRLADRLAHHARQEGVVVLGLPRGGVPVAEQVARRLDAPLDVFVVRKLGVPGHEELAMGAIASGGVRTLNENVLWMVGIDAETIEHVTETERAELERREVAYRAGRPALEVAGRTCILVDDGLATGASMRAAVEALRRRGAGRIVVAVPVAPVETCAELARQVDEVVCAMTPDPFFGVGRWYDDFAQVSDDEVRAALARAAQGAGAGAPGAGYGEVVLKPMP